MRVLNPDVRAIRKKTSTLCHACAGRLFDEIDAANTEANTVIRQGEGPTLRKCRDCKRRRPLYWFVFEYGLDESARRVPVYVQGTADAQEE